MAAFGFGYNNEAIVFLLHVFVGEAQLAEKFHAADFKPDVKVGVVYDAHLVGFGIAHTDGRFVKTVRAIGISIRVVFGMT